MEETYLSKPWIKNYDTNVSPKLTCENRTFAQKFAEAVLAYPDKTAMIYLGKELTYRELDSLSDRLAHYLIKTGLKPDDVVGLHLPNIPAHYVGFVSVQKAGCVSTGLGPLLTPAELAPFDTVLVMEIANVLPGVKRVAV